jgi:23S rRNA (uridine2552-2'-O)-methyltransferase
MAPKLSGVRASDEARSVELAQTGLDVAERILRPGGRLLLKVFMSPHVRDLRARAEGMFRDVKITKPEASRKGSAEVYLVGLVRSRLAARIDAAKSGGTSIT